MTRSPVRHTIFKTRWGHFGLAFNAEALCRTILPIPDRERARAALLAHPDLADLDVPFEKDLARALQRHIIAYFEGENRDFSTAPPVDLARRGPFARQTLAACRRIPFGQTRSYAQLADEAGRTGAARAAGTAMAQNPIPLIVPCHRVVRADGALGGFSALGGTTTKQRLLRHEQDFQHDSTS
jgi:methylated-DNA-[protein]-cysteine S-methyltransferase